ncbi:ATP-binding cassette domain-containing protein, partial [Micromonospora sp. DT31]|uniref:ATP-binding cassette domain-containing protein n=1 Tax=Micromonospora sp. DT31 TaxID=3393434 RepID=UPI003CF83B58
MLATRGLTWRIGEVAIVDSVYLDLAPGEFLGVIGPNGAGKTSLFNLITGLRRPTEGTVLLDGTDITALPPHRRARLGLGRTFQASSVFGSLTVRENVRLAVQAHRGGSMKLWRRGGGARAGGPPPPPAGGPGGRPPPRGGRAGPHAPRGE